jgi:hypothetical protein
MTGEIFASLEFRRGIVARIKPGMEGTPYNDAISDLIKLDKGCERSRVIKKLKLK